MKLQDALAANLAPAVVDNGDGTFSPVVSVLGGGGSSLVPELTGPSAWDAGALMRYGDGLYMTNAATEITSPPSPSDTANPDLLYIGPASGGGGGGSTAGKPKLTVSLAYGVSIPTTAETPLAAQLQVLENENSYIKDDGFDGDISIDGNIGGGAGSVGDLVFSPVAGKIYAAEIIGNLYSGTAGGTIVKLGPASGVAMVATATLNGLTDGPMTGKRVISGDNGDHTLRSLGSSIEAITTYGFVLEITQLN